MTSRVCASVFLRPCCMSRTCHAAARFRHLAAYMAVVWIAARAVVEPTTHCVCLLPAEAKLDSAIASRAQQQRAAATAGQQQQQPLEAAPEEQQQQQTQTRPPQPSAGVSRAMALRRLHWKNSVVGELLYYINIAKVGGCGLLMWGFLCTAAVAAAAAAAQTRQLYNADECRPACCVFCCSPYQTSVLVSLLTGGSLRGAALRSTRMASMPLHGLNTAVAARRHLPCFMLLCRRAASTSCHPPGSRCSALPSSGCSDRDGALLPAGWDCPYNGVHSACRLL
jgi:hypothetical protein